MRRVLLICISLALCLCACGGQEWQNLRQFCESYSKLAGASAQLAKIEPGQFMVRPEDDGAAYHAWLGDDMLLGCAALQSGRVHTISLTCLPEQSRSAFFEAARCAVQAYTGAAADQAERWLHQVQAGESEVLGVLGVEEAGFRFSYAANQAGRHLRISQLRFLPPEPELPTLREHFTED